jgi:hypothetical protein
MPLSLLSLLMNQTENCKWILSKYVGTTTVIIIKFQILLQLDKNYSHFAWKPTWISLFLSRVTFSVFIKEKCKL